MAASRAAASENSRGRPIFVFSLWSVIAMHSLRCHFYTIQSKKDESCPGSATSETYGSKVTAKGGNANAGQTGRQNRTRNGRQQRDWARHRATFRKRRGIRLHHGTSPGGTRQGRENHWDSGQGGPGGRIEAGGSRPALRS